MKLNEITNQHTEIEALLKIYAIKNYKILQDGTVNVKGSVEICSSFEKLPIKFGSVSGTFDCSHCPQLVSLEGVPHTVGGSFYSNSCPQLTSLVGSPSTIGGSWDCSRCTKITSLEGVSSSSIGGDFYCTWSNIKSGGIGLILTGCKQLVGVFDEGPFEIIEKYIGRPEDIFECQVELIEAGFEEYARL